MKNEVITILNPNPLFGLLTYIDIKATKTAVYGIQHRLNSKSVIYGRSVSRYNKDMDFSNAIAAGCIIIKDLRDERKNCEDDAA